MNEWNTKTFGSIDCSASSKQQSIQLLWGAFVVIQTLIVMSRMYIAAHFPHQCALGLFLGVSIAHQIYGSSKWLNLKRSQWLLVASLILASAIGTYSFLLLTGRNPAWSISQAYKWCAKREYIHVDTTPFYSLTRYSGAAFGLGLGLTSK
jgi:glucose-6-phosphatase